MPQEIKNLSDLVKADPILAKTIHPFVEETMPVIHPYTDSPELRKLVSETSKPITSLTGSKDELTFVNGNYDLGTHKELLTNAEKIGNEIIAAAERKGIKVTDLPEFKNADLNNGGKVDAKEIGALMLASTMNTQTGESWNMFRPVSPDSPDSQKNTIGDTDIVSTFRNNLNGNDIAKLLDPKTADQAKLIASSCLAIMAFPERPTRPKLICSL